MKKFIALVSCLLLAFSLTACQKGQQQDPKQIYAAAVEKNAVLNSMETDMTINMGIDLGGTSMNMKLDGKIMEVRKDDDYQMLAEISMNMLGQDISSKQYYKDGICYVDTMGQKMQYPMEIDDVMEQLGSSDEFFQIDADVFTKFDMAREGDNYVFTMEADQDSLQDLMDTIMGSLSGMTGEGVMDIADLDMTAFQAKYVVNKDGYFTSMDMNMDYSMEVEGQQMSYTMEINLTVPNPGQEITIDFPDFSDFEEVDPSLIA